MVYILLNVTLLFFKSKVLEIPITKKQFMASEHSTRVSRIPVRIRQSDQQRTPQSKLSFLFSLYRSIVVSIFNGWISDKDLCYLDNATTNHRNRDSLFSVFSNCWLCVSEDISNREERYLWYLRRQLRLRKFNIQTVDLIESSSAVQLLQASGHIAFLEVPDAADTIHMLKPLQLTVDCLKVRLVHGKYIAAILKTMKNIASLDLCGTVELSAELLNAIGSMCPNLKRLSLPRQTMIQNSADLVLDAIDCSGHVFDAKIHPFLNHSCSLVKTNPSHESVVEVNGQHYEVQGLVCTQPYTGREDVQALSPYVSRLHRLRVEFGSVMKLHQYPLISAVSVKCTSLTSLYVCHVKFEGDDLLHIIQNNTRLRSIELSRCETITRDVLDAVTKCTELTEFKLLHVNVPEDSALSIFQKCPRLTSLLIGGTVLSDLTLNCIAGRVRSMRLEPTNQITLDLSDNREVHCLVYWSYHSVQYPLYNRVLALNPGLLVFYASVMLELDNYFICTLTVFCPLLQSVTLRYCKCFTGECLAYIADLKHLTTLSVTDMMDVTDDVVYMVVRDKPGLTSLTLSDCTGFSGSVLSLMAYCCPNLKHFDVSRVRTITNKDVIALLNGCPKLNYLNVENTPVTAEIFPALTAKKVMRYLNISYCNIEAIEVKDFLANSGFVCTCELHCECCRVKPMR